MPRVVKQDQEEVRGYVSLDLFGQRIASKSGHAGAGPQRSLPHLELLLEAARKLWSSAAGSAHRVGVPRVAPFVLPVRWVGLGGFVLWMLSLLMKALSLAVSKAGPGFSCPFQRQVGVIMEFAQAVLGYSSVCVWPPCATCHSYPSCMHACSLTTPAPL